MKKLLSVAFTAAVLPLAVMAPEASADELELPELSCLYTAVANFNPPLFAGGQSDVDGYALLYGCISPNGEHPDITSGVYRTTGVVATAISGLNPCNLLLEEVGPVEIEWNNGQISHGDGTFSTNPSNLKIAGEITYETDADDPFYEYVATVLPVAFTPNLDCLTGGLKSLTLFAGTYTIGLPTLP